MNNAWKYWMLAIALAVWWALAWLAGPWLNLGGKDLWTLRGALALIGLAAFITCVWWFRGLDADRAATLAEVGTAGSDEIDILMRKAQVRLQAAGVGRSALRDWPAMIVLGEAGSAKTSVIFQSGTEPQLLAGHAVQNDVTIPTRALNLWVARQFLVAEAGAPLLDEPPRWAHLIKKFAPGGARLLGQAAVPPRLALLCIDCEKLLAPGVAATLGAKIDQWRTRLRETSQLLGINLPVYVLFTRADRLQYFLDYVAPLSNEEAANVFGAVLPAAAYSAGSYADQETAAVSAAFDNLIQGLGDGRLPLLARQLESPKAPAVYEFPREFKKLRSILVPLLVEICRPGPSRTTPFLRGFYFTGTRYRLVSVSRSAAQEDVLSAAATFANLNATRVFNKDAAGGQMPGTEIRKIPQWVFLPQFFGEVLFKDSSALSTSTLSTKVGLGRRLVLAAAMGMLLMLTVGFTVSSIRNKRLENQVMTALQDIAEVRPPGRQLPSLDELRSLESLRQSVETLTSNEHDGPPFSMRWGLYVGESLLPDAQRIYFQRFQEMLFQPAQTAVLESLRSLPDSPGPNDRYDPAFDALKAYLLTTSDPAKSDDEYPSHILLRAWTAGRDIDPTRMQLAQKQFDFYANQLKTGNPFSSESDAKTVARAHHYLEQFPGDERVYRLIVGAADKANPPVDFYRQFPAAAEAVAEPTVVSGAFTKAGWSFMQSALANPAQYFSAESWVLGQVNLSATDMAKRANELRRKYQEQYIAQWRSFLSSATLNHPVSLGSAAQELQKLSSDPSPVLALFCVAAQNTTIDQPDVSRAFQAVQSVAPRDCQDPATGPLTAAYLKSLSNLQACTNRADNSPTEQKDSAKAQCRTEIPPAEQTVARIAEGFQTDPDAHADQTVKDLLLAPINDTAVLLRPGPVSAAALCTQMSTLESLFPFSAQASQEVSLQAFATVFAPTKGAVSQFYSSALKGLLYTKGADYMANPSAPQTVSPTFLTFFNRAMYVQRALYPNGGGPAQFRYSLRPVSTENVSSLSLTIDGQSLSYSGGAAQFTSMSWPGTSGQGVRLTVKIPGGAELGFPSYDGVWGAFRFFNDATVLQHNGNFATLQWALGGDRPVTAPNGKPVTVQFDVDTEGSPPVWKRDSSQVCVAFPP